MIAINELTVSWGAFTLLDHINLHIGDNEKIGLVGKNGAGKSTLLKVILGQALPTSGAVVVSKGQRIGYLPQQMEHSKEHSVIDETLKAFDELFRLQSRIDEVSSLLAQRTDYESALYNNLIVELNNLQDKVAIMESEPPHSQAERVLMGLGFKREEFNRPTAELSQGWNMRIELAKILLSKPDILLLDEPTNHLDIESIQWFEEYLKTFRGSVVLISHDRKFLDNITKRTVEITLGKINDYKVPYSQYKVLRSERMEQQRSAYENQQRMIEKSEEFIERFRYKATKSNQVQSRIKALDKLERIEIEVDDTSAINVKFPPAPRSGQVVFKTNDAVLGYRNKEAAPPKVVLQKSNIVIERGEKVAFVGRNGEGKTTMMRVLIGELEPLEGQAENGYNVSLGYYAQNQEDILVKSDTVFSTLDNIAVGDIRTKLRDILGAFLFKGEDVDKKVDVLSGGERARLAMAKLMLKPYNLLALDEPTNHMDILSKEILKNALKKYDGTLVIVSHDRDFLQGLVDKVYEFKDGKVREHLGGIENYLEHLKAAERALMKEEVKALQSPQKQPITQAAEKPESEKSSRNNRQDEIYPKESDSQKYRQESKEQRRKKKELERLENEITELDNKLAQIESMLTGNNTPDKIAELSELYQATKQQRDNKLDEWVVMQ